MRDYDSVKRRKVSQMLDRYAARADETSTVAVAGTDEAMAAIRQWWLVDRNHQDPPTPQAMEQYRRLFEAAGRIRVVDQVTTTLNCGGERFTRDCVLVVERAEAVS